MLAGERLEKHTASVRFWQGNLSASRTAAIAAGSTMPENHNALPPAACPELLVPSKSL